MSCAYCEYRCIGSRDSSHLNSLCEVEITRSESYGVRMQIVWPMKDQENQHELLSYYRIEGLKDCDKELSILTPPLLLKRDAVT